MKIYLCKSYISGLNGYVFLNVFAVEAYVASWIEILTRREEPVPEVRSRLT